MYTKNYSTRQFQSNGPCVCWYCDDEKNTIDIKGYCSGCSAYNDYMDYKYTYCLFEGRHELPDNRGAIIKEFDFNWFENIYNVEKLNEIKDVLRDGKKRVFIIVTGLTPALTNLLHELEYNKMVTLVHYNSQKKYYIEQGL